ncbi:hypothetical protein FRB94_004979 [Tulasnella sp. JGI-2019a]|nr:hypothetical protein FRB94_004979 [Tulasnella sp. JGI-2019a]
MGGTSTEVNQPLQSVPPVEWLSFSGGTSDSVLQFTQGVHRFAFAHGRQRDDGWMADYAYGCLSGQALNWFEDLDRDVKQDWARLRPTMINKFRDTATEPYISASRARIKLLSKDSGVTLGYVGHPSSAHATFQTSPQGSLVIDIPAIKSPQNTLISLQLVEPSTLPFLGLEDKGGYLDLPSPPSGAPVSKVWYIEKANGIEELRTDWTESNGSRTPLQPGIWKSTIEGKLPVTAPTQFWLRKSLSTSEETLKFVLERL